MPLRTFQQAVRELDFTLTAELPLRPDSTRASLARDADALGDVVDALQITDSPEGIPHMSPLVAAGICLGRDRDAVLHVSGRDRNRIALQSDLLGAAAAGVTSLLLYRGDKLPDSVKPRSKPVHEFGAKRLLRCASLIGGEAELLPSPGFFLGSRISVIAPRQDWHPRGIETKAEVGCKFVQTQPLFDLKLLGAYMRRLVESRVVRRVSVIVSVPVPTSASELDALLSRRRPALIPRPLVERLGKTRTPREDGIAIAAETLAAAAEIPGVSGANLVAIENVDAALRAISLSEIRA